MAVTTDLGLFETLSALDGICVWLLGEGCEVMCVLG